MTWKVSILEYIEDHPACTLPEAAAALDAPLRAAAAALFELKAEGVVREGASRGGQPMLSVHYGAAVAAVAGADISSADPRPLTDRVPAGREATSIAAFESIEGAQRTDDQRRVYRFILDSYAGATGAEIEDALGLLHQTASARLNDLSRANLIERRGAKRPTPTGRSAYVWTAVSAASVAEVEDRPIRPPYVSGPRVPCLGGCGELVGPGQKCPACAASAVDDWRHTRDAAARDAERRARPAIHWKQPAPKTRPRRAAKRAGA